MNYDNDREYAAESRIEQIAFVLIKAHGLDNREWQCNDERADVLAKIVIDAALLHGLTDEQAEYLRGCINDLASPADPVEALAREAAEKTEGLDTKQRRVVFETYIRRALNNRTIQEIAKSQALSMDDHIRSVVIPKNPSRPTRYLS